MTKCLLQQEALLNMTHAATRIMISWSDFLFTFFILMESPEFYIMSFIWVYGKGTVFSRKNNNNNNNSAHF